MGDKSAIEWTDATWNPLAGCTPISEGCLNCYAATTALRLESMGQTKYSDTAKRNSAGRPVFTGNINLHPKSLLQPLKWKRPRRVFVNSMSDLFHEGVPDDYIRQVWDVMGKAHWHTFQVLTKRPERMATWVKGYYGDQAPYPNIWVGTSVEDQRAADERIPHLLHVPATVRFLSCEPLLGPVDLDAFIGEYDCHACGYRGSDVGKELECPTCEERYSFERQECPHCGKSGDENLTCPRCGSSEGGTGAFGKFSTNLYLEETDGIHWVIVGGESGHYARPMHPDWARSLRDQCQTAKAPFFFKQWGEWHYDPMFTPQNPERIYMEASGERFQFASDEQYRDGRLCFDKVGKHKSGRELDGRTWDEMPTTQQVQA